MAPDTLLTLDRVAPLSVALLLALAVVGASLAGQVYVVSRAGNRTGSDLYRATPVLGLALTALFLTVQFSLPISLGLLAALSLTRLRVPVKEPEEIALVMLICAVAVAAASLKLSFLGVVLLVGLLAALSTPRLAAAARRTRLSKVVIRLAVPQAAATRGSSGAESIDLGRGARLRSIRTAAAAIQLEYHVPHLSPDAIQSVLTRLQVEVPAARVEITDVEVRVDQPV